MKKKTVSRKLQTKIRAQFVNANFRTRCLQQRTKALASRKRAAAKAAALKVKVKKAALKDKAQRKKASNRMLAQLAAVRAKEEALLSPEALLKKRRLESLVSKDFKEVIKKIVKDDVAEVKRLHKGNAETMDTDQELSEQQLWKLNRAVDAAMKLFKDMWIEFVFEYDRGNADGDERDERADAWLETVVATRYEELRATMTNLLPWLPRLLPSDEGSEYSVIEFDGQQPQHLQKDGANWRLLGAQYKDGRPALEKVIGASLACGRRDPKFRALEAFCVMLALLSNRKEKSFLEAFATREELDQHMKALQKKGVNVKSKTSARRKHEIREWLEKQYLHGFGFFSHFLVKPYADMRVAFKPGVPTPIPVSVIAVEHITLFDALGSPDTGDGSFIGAPKSFEWCTQKGTEFAFQAAIHGVPEKDHIKKHRQPTEDLQPNPELRALLLGRKPILYLEVIAALAPREVAKREGLSAIVIAELARLMREAKSRGEAVLFCLGSDSPHTLAEKVYLRKPIGDHGLTCGYFRWRKSAEVPWAREAFWEDRPCHCLQMP